MGAGEHRYGGSGLACGPALPAVFADDGAIVAGCEDGYVRVWNHRGQLRQTLPHPAQPHPAQPHPVSARATAASRT